MALFRGLSITPEDRAPPRKVAAQGGRTILHGMNAPRNFEVARFGEIEAVRCPCGWARRAFASVPGGPASVHLVEIEDDARCHYHKGMTEIYVILQGEGHLELDGELLPVGPMTTVMIKPGCRHRALGRMTLLNIPVPAFDPADEWFD